MNILQHQRNRTSRLESADGLRKLLRGFSHSPVAVSTPRGALRPYRLTLLADGRPALRKTVKPRHELTTPPGAAVDESVLLYAEKLGFAGVVIERLSTGQVLWAPLSLWKSGFPVRRGFGPQRGLLWDQLKPLSFRPEQASSAQGPAAQQQLLLSVGGA